MTDVELQDVDRCRLEESLHIPPRVETFAKGNRNRRQKRQLLDRLGMLAQQRLFDKQGTYRLKDPSQLLCHRLVQTAVKIDADIDPKRFDFGHALSDLI